MEKEQTNNQVFDGKPTDNDNKEEWKQALQEYEKMKQDEEIRQDVLEILEEDAHQSSRKGVYDEFDEDF